MFLSASLLNEHDSATEVSLLLKIYLCNEMGVNLHWGLSGGLLGGDTALPSNQEGIPL